MSSTLEWKHWKTYENHFAKSYDTFVQNVGKLIKAEALMAYMYIKPEEPLRLLRILKEGVRWNRKA